MRLQGETPRAVPLCAEFWKSCGRVSSATSRGGEQVLNGPTVGSLHEVCGSVMPHRRNSRRHCAPLQVVGGSTGRHSSKTFPWKGSGTISGRGAHCRQDCAPQRNGDMYPIRRLSASIATVAMLAMWDAGRPQRCSPSADLGCDVAASSLGFSALHLIVTAQHKITGLTEVKKTRRYSGTQQFFPKKQRADRPREGQSVTPPSAKRRHLFMK